MLKNSAATQIDAHKNPNINISNIMMWGQDIPSWMRIVSGVLGFLTSFLLVTRIMDKR